MAHRERGVGRSPVRCRVCGPGPRHLVTTGVALWTVAITYLVIAAGILWATERTRSGSRLAACVLLGLFVLAKLVDVQPLRAGALWSVIIIIALANGIWGTFALARTRREALLVPPAPPKHR